MMDGTQQAGRKLRWWVVSGRAAGTCYTLGRYLAGSPAAAIARAIRRHGSLTTGLRLSAEVSR